MGQAKQRGTYTERVKQAKSKTEAISAAKRAAAVEDRRARIALNDGRVLVVDGGADRRANGVLIRAALLAALAPL